MFSFTHVTPYLRMAFCFSVMSFVVNPELSKLKDGAEVGRVQFVKQSASMIAVDTQQHVV